MMGLFVKRGMFGTSVFIHVRIKSTMQVSSQKCLMHTEEALLCIRIINPIKLQVIHQDTIENVSIKNLQENTLYIDTVPSTQTAPAAEGMKVLAALVNPEHRAGKADQLQERSEAKSLGLENALQEGQVDDAGLTG